MSRLPRQVALFRRPWWSTGRRTTGAPSRRTRRGAGRGPILVRITEASIEPLWDCSLGDGSKYEYTGVSPKRDHVVRMIGISELNRLSVRRADLSAQCQNATHFVKELTIGAGTRAATELRRLPSRTECAVTKDLRLRARAPAKIEGPRRGTAIAVAAYDREVPP